LGFDRSSVRYTSSRPDDAGLRLRLRQLASTRRRFGWPLFSDSRLWHLVLTEKARAALAGREVGRVRGKRGAEGRWRGAPGNASADAGASGAAMATGGILKM